MPPVRSLPTAKKRKLSHGDEIKALETRLASCIANNDSLNPLADLLDLTLTFSEPQDTSKAIYALYRIYVLIITGGKLEAGGDDDAKVVKAWIWEQLDGYVSFLAGLLKDNEKLLRTSSLQILFSLLKHISTSLSKSHPTPQFHITHFRKIVAALLLCPPSSRPSAQALEPSKLETDVRDQFIDTWLSVNDDVRWFFLRESATLLGKHPTDDRAAENLLAILSRLTTFPTDPSELNSWWISELGAKPKMPNNKKKLKGKSSAVDNEDSEDDDGPPKREDGEDEEDDDWRKFFDEPADDGEGSASKSKSGGGARVYKMNVHQSLHSLASNRAVFTRAWLTLLPRLSEPGGTSTKVLVTRALNVMHRGVLPHLTRAVLVMDWISACVDYGGSVGLLALNALFILMKDYNLDYPAFYTRLYAFLDREVLHLKYRARFFRMLELFLSSTHLPTTLLASFIKRLARLSLTAPPAAIIMIIPFIYNTLKKHPALMVMIHRTDYGDTPDGTDPYNPTEPNPLFSNALASSLWELNTQREHYHSAVSTLAKIFSEAFTKQAYSMEDFLDHTYATLFDTEAGRKIKKEPALAMELELGKGADLFPIPAIAAISSGEGEGEGEDTEMETLIAASVGVGGDVVTQLWCFG
ncbi:CBF-domain-containing protein [Pleurotus eryngii]|uniref:CBF-domain-containing protein n=1 Tax=Pleurotus eryngii TaxID=5323 RepID=A0A9P6DKE4_PLEER|nr:CBF-domain-containing protein [Pleurotus eryngii]